MKLIIVESPNKVKKVQAYAGKGYQVAASVGHITKLADTRPHQLGFEIVQGEIEIDFHPNGARGKQTTAKLRKLARNCDEIILATDPDREGEAIAWHCAQQVARGKTISRMTYTEITQSAIQNALQNKRQLDLDLVYAQMSRQLLDKWIGYVFSGPLLNSTKGQCRSVGRVQSAALAIVVEVEHKITAFEPTPYWALKATYQEGFSAHFICEKTSTSLESTQDEQGEKGTKASLEPTQDEQTDGTRVLSEAEAQRLVAIAQSHPHQVLEATIKALTIQPPPPLTTSALQQIAGATLGYASDKTMNIAQTLFENGLISYHRTDSVTLSAEFRASVRQWLQANHPQLVPTRTKKHRTNPKAQAAHEAIRPTDVNQTPDQLQGISDEQQALYRLIWQRAIASLAAPAKVNKTCILIQAGSTNWQCSGSVITSAGYTTLFNNLKPDEHLPTVSNGQQLTPTHIGHTRKMTTPPRRLSEPQLVAKLEKAGIGRPSTYASIMKTLRQRRYVQATGRGKQQRLKPTPSGITCYNWLTTALPVLIDATFTAQMEARLDLIATGQEQWEHYLIGFGSQVISPALATIKQCFPNALEKPSKPQQNELTDYICTICQQPLALIRYQKNGSNKQMLKCSKHPKQHPTYFWTKNNTFWNPQGASLETKKSA